MISSNEILTLINALGLDPKSQEIDIKDLRYGKIIFIPLFKKASSLILLIKIFPLNFIDENISFDGRKVICVPVSFDLPVVFKGASASPFLNFIKCFLPSL